MRDRQPASQQDTFSSEPPRVTLHCRVCRRKFVGRYDSYLESRLLAHVDRAHPDDALPFSQEFAELARQVDEVFSKLGKDF